ncbi:MAG: hypothetical protein BGO49_13295 [Planctomycetales bacterium 71-10]|nr:MAG: hypothetical protein BGO49_13295 [Planctomycetales bacterium 71-10]
MGTDRRRIGAEVATVALVAACLGGTLNLVISVHRKALQVPKVAQAVPPPAPESAPTPEPPQEPPRGAEAPRPAPTPPPPPAEDPTPKALAQIADATAAEREAAGRLDREAEKLEQARKVAEAEAESWRRREMLVKQQLATLDDKARKTTREVDAYAAQRDVLARERDALKAAIAAAPGEGSYAILPYQGENGTWRRPIVIECTGGKVSILPNGPTFTLLELSGLANPRSSPVVVAIARELLKVKTSASPDGSEVVPYFVFLVRPDGVRSYYEVRARLEPLGIAFGYELVEADMKVHIPDFDNVASWDGTPTLDVPPSGLAGHGSKGGGDGSSGDRPAGVWPNGGGGDGQGAVAAGGLSWPGGGGGGKPGSGAGTLAGGGLAWPGGGAGDGDRALAGAFDAGRGRAAGGGGDGDGPEAFVWPSQRPGAGGGALEKAGGAPADESGSKGLGAGGATRGESPLGHDVGRAGPLGAGIKAATRDIGRPDLARRGEGAGLDRPGAGPRASASRGLEPAPTVPGSEPDLGGGLMWGDTAPAGVTSSVAQGYRGGRLAGEKPAAGASAAAPGVPAEELTLSDAVAGAVGSGAGATAGGSTPGTGTSAGANPGGRSAAGSSGTGSGSKPPPIGLGAGGGGARTPLGLGSSGGPATPGLMLGGESEPAKGGGGAGGAGQDDARMQPLVQDPEKKRPPAIEVPFEIVVACTRDGVTIQPGNRKITTQALKNRRQDELLIRNLEAEALRRSEVDPAIKPRPRVKFLVQEDGAANFWEARRQVLFSGLDWPMTLQVAGAQNPRLLDDKGIW